MVLVALAAMFAPIARLGVLWFLLLAVRAPWWTFLLALVGELCRVEEKPRD